MVKNASSPTSRAWWPAVVIVGAACVFCWPVLLGRVMLPADMCLLMLPWRSLQSHFPEFQRVYNPMFDPIQQYLPWRVYAVESVRSGLIPLWNPYAFCGTPFLANLQSALLYPPSVLFLLTGARHGFGVSAILHLALGGLSMYGLLRTLGTRRAPALFGALVLMFNGFTVTWLEFPTLSLWVFMWLPAVLLCYEMALRRPRSLWPAACALVLGVQFLGGHLQVSAYVVMAFLLYAVVRRARPAAGGSGRALGLVMAAVSIGLGLTLAAGQILPTLELARETGRLAGGGTTSTATAFPLSHLVLYLVPNFFGNPVHYNYWGHFRDPSAINFFETACYAGVLPLFLAAWALRRWRRAEVCFFGCLTAFAVLVAIGSPVYLLLSHVLPGFAGFAGLGRILCLAAFGLAGMAAFGLDDLLNCTERRSTRLMALCGVVGAAAIGVAWVAFRPYVEVLPPDWQFSGYLGKQVVVFLVLATAAVVLIGLRARMRLGASWFAVLSIAILIVDLFGLGIRFNPFVDARMAYPETETTRWLEENAGHFRIASITSDGLDWMAHNSPMIFGLRDIHGSDSLRVKRSFELVSGPDLDQASYPEPDSPLLDALSVRYLVTRRQVGDGWRLASSVEAPVYENLEVHPRAYLVEEGAAAGAQGPETVRFESDGEDRIVFAVEGGSGGELILTDSFYPGWRAWVDGEPVSIRRADEAFRGVLVPPGTHTVEFRYEPASFRVGLFLSLLALGALTAAAATLHLLGRASASATAARS